MCVYNTFSDDSTVVCNFNSLLFSANGVSNATVIVTHNRLHKNLQWKSFNNILIKVKILKWFFFRKMLIDTNAMRG